MSDLNGLTIDSNGVSFETVSDVDSEFCELVYGIFENLNGEQKRSNYYLEQLRDEERINRNLAKENSLLISLYECFADYLFDQIEYNTDYNLLNEIIHLETQVKGLESDVRTYQNHDCSEIAVTVEDDTWQDTKPEMGTAVKDTFPVYINGKLTMEEVILPNEPKRIFS